MNRMNCEVLTKHQNQFVCIWGYEQTQGKMQESILREKIMKHFICHTRFTAMCCFPLSE